MKLLFIFYQSYQCGIEIKHQLYNVLMATDYQSYQCGIEIEEARQERRGEKAINRTNVELKYKCMFHF